MDLEERLAAFVDGELDPAEHTRFEAQIRADPAIGAEVERQARLRSLLAAAYDPVLAEPTPARLVMAASTANDRTPRNSGLARWGAMAACLAVGVLLGRAALPEGGPVAMKGGLLLARGDLARGLDRNLAAEKGEVRIGVSFREAGGTYCRTFQSARDRLAGVACREKAGWVSRTLTVWTPTQSPAYRTAASAMPPEVLASVDSTISGDPLDAEGEREARARGWRAPR
jgi:hypothetical protein